MPQWLGAARAPRAFPIADSFDTAGGWRIVGPDFYTCIEPADGPFVDREAMDYLHAFDPGAIPIWRKQVYLPPGKIGRHGEHVVSTVMGLSRHVKDPRGPHRIFYVEMPVAAGFSQPNVLETLFRIRNFKDGGPDVPLRFTMQTALMLERIDRKDRSAADLHQEQLDRLERRRAEAAKFAEEMEYRRRHLNKNIQGLLERLDLDDFHKYGGRVRAPRVHVFLGKGA